MLDLTATNSLSQLSRIQTVEDSDYAPARAFVERVAPGLNRSYNADIANDYCDVACGKCGSADVQRSGNSTGCGFCGNVEIAPTTGPQR